MTAYVDLQEREFARESEGYTAVKHQREVGAGYFDQIATIVSGGNASTLALEVRPRKNSSTDSSLQPHNAVLAAGLCECNNKRATR